MQFTSYVSKKSYLYINLLLFYKKLISYDKNKLLQRLALGVVTAQGVIQDNVPGSWRQIAHVCRDLPELTVK